LSPALLGLQTISQVTVSQLPQGVWNFNYLAQIDGKKFVLKVYQSWPRSKSMFTLNSGQREFETLKLLKGLNIAPNPVCFERKGLAGEQDALIYEYAAGNTLSYSKQIMLEMAALYAKLHGLNPERAPFLPRRDESLGALMGALELKLAHYVQRNDIPETLKARFTRCFELSRQHIANAKPLPYLPAILHADPVAGNIIVGDRPVLIDWQSVMIGDPAFDIWAFTAAPFSLWDLDAKPSKAQQDLFRQTYLSLQDDFTLPDRIAVKEPLYLLEYGLHLSTRYYDYKSGKMPPQALIGREANFEKYGPNAEVALTRLREILGS